MSRRLMLVETQAGFYVTDPATGLRVPQVWVERQTDGSLAVTNALPEPVTLLIAEGGEQDVPGNWRRHPLPAASEEAT